MLMPSFSLVPLACVPAQNVTKIHRRKGAAGTAAVHALQQRVHVVIYKALLALGAGGALRYPARGRQREQLPALAHERLLQSQRVHDERFGQPVRLAMFQTGFQQRSEEGITWTGHVTLMVRAIIDFRVMQLNFGKALTESAAAREGMSSQGMLPFLRPSARSRLAHDKSSERAQPMRCSASATAM